jgi:hypothetical protein
MSTSLGWIAGQTEARSPWRAVSCALFGHSVDNRDFARQGSAPRQCPCGEPYLGEDGSETRVRHTLSCFLGQHHYSRTGTRDGHNEYVCVPCGHPLLFAVGSDPYADGAPFAKKVRYLCNLFGHRVHTVCARHGYTEYACGCGHTFLRAQAGLARVTHPPLCALVGHFIRFVERRDGHAEHLCRNCGHTFNFVAAG